MHQASWPRTEAEPDDPPGTARRKVKLAPLPRGAVVRFGFEPDPMDPLDAPGRPRVLEHDRPGR